MPPKAQRSKSTHGVTASMPTFYAIKKMKEKIIKNKRIENLKSVKSLANKYLEENKSLKSISKGWKLDVVENNIRQLKEIIKKLNYGLSEKSLEEHVRLGMQLGDFQKGLSKKLSFDIKAWAESMGEGFMFFKILRYSASYSIIHDLYWIEDGTVNDQIEIATGNKSPEILGKFLSGKLGYIEMEVFPYLENDKKYKPVIAVFQAAIKESKSESYLTSNILLITGIESLVRILGNFVYSIQNPALSEEEVDEYIFKKFLSLESLISKGDWKEDLYVTLADALLMNEYIFDESIQKAEEIKIKNIEAQQVIMFKLNEYLEYVKNEEIEKDEEVKKSIMKEKLEEMQNIAEANMINYDEENIAISLKTKLQFLLRTYKEDRNQLIHGNFTDFNKKWKNYIYFWLFVTLYG